MPTVAVQQSYSRVVGVVGMIYGEKDTKFD